MRAWNRKRKPKHHTKVKWKTTYFFESCLVMDIKKHEKKVITRIYRPSKYCRKLHKKSIRINYKRKFKKIIIHKNDKIKFRKIRGAR